MAAVATRHAHEFLATGQEVVLLPKHGLFFIPAKGWTWILAILTIPMMIGGAADERQTARDAAIPGYKAFNEVSLQDTILTARPTRHCVPGFYETSLRDGKPLHVSPELAAPNTVWCPRFQPLARAGSPV